MTAQSTQPAPTALSQTQLEAIAASLLFTAPGLRPEQFRRLAPALAIAAGSVDKEFARVEQNYPAQRNEDLEERERQRAADSDAAASLQSAVGTGRIASTGFAEESRSDNPGTSP